MKKREAKWLLAQKQQKFLRQMRGFHEMYHESWVRMKGIIRNAKPKTEANDLQHT